MFAARVKRGQDAQVGIREEPAFSLAADHLSGAHERAEVFAPRDGAKMLDADSRQCGNFVFGEGFFGGFDCNHFPTLG